MPEKSLIAWNKTALWPNKNSGLIAKLVAQDLPDSFLYPNL